MAENSASPAAATSALPNSEVDNNKPEVAPETSTPSKPEAAQKGKSDDNEVDSETKGNGSVPNGDAAVATTGEETSSKADPPATTGGDIEMKDFDASEPSGTATVAVGGTPASAKKTPNGSAKKKAAVPEHKTRKLNKKKSKQTLQLYAKPGELYLARMKGHQPWPSIICDEAMLPQSLLSSRPVTTTLPDGTFKKEDYAPGGKREGERTFPIMFLYTNEFAWLPNTELTPLSADDCKDVAEKGKSKGLIEAYKVAAEGNDISYYKGLLSDHQKALDEEAERRAERDAKKAEKANKGKRKSNSAADTDAMDVDEDETPKTSKKRKKSIVEDDTEEKPAKTPKTKVKLNVGPPTTPADSASKKSKVKSTPKPKGSGKKSAKASTSDDELETPKVEEPTMTPAEAKEKKEKEIRYYRHKLQKGFITRDYTPKDDEIQTLSGYLGKLENYPDLEGSIIRATKINKVLKAMIRLGSIPKDEEFNFKKRSQDLLTKWNVILNSDLTGAEDGKDDKDADDEAKGDKGSDKEKDEAKPEPNGIKASNATTGDKEKPAESEKSAEPAKITETEKIAEPPKAEKKASEPPKDTKPSNSETKIETSIEGEKSASTKPTESEKPAEEAKADKSTALAESTEAAA